ncbi:hypothetical protein LTR17_009412 [Elasticomyces elasticus]|nr:hypothetical protein LTR17_009412 [Elasticomyces elasticus]
MTQPAVVIIARHGLRLDAADQSWHLSTPTPYDPPLTYGGWNQSRALGVRIASLLHLREQAASNAESEPSRGDHVTSHDFAGQHDDEHSKDSTAPRKRKKKQKVVIHTSPFLRCVETSVAIAAGMAQFQTSSSQPVSRPSTSVRSRTPTSLHSVSPHLKGKEGHHSPGLAPISEPRADFAHAIARKVLDVQRRHQRFKLRVDAFLGEWLNPDYFEHITPPPPSAMMVATAKAELMQSETVDIFTPSLSTKSSGGDLWGSGTKAGGKDDALEDWNDVQSTLAAPVARRDRASSVSSVGSNDSSIASGRKSPFRAGHSLQPFTSTVPKPEASVYVPPIPHYAISASDQIPRGYVTHARQACVSPDTQWDSSRPPQDWGDGAELGEEWSAMHKRFRRGLNHLIHWYSQHNADDRAEDALGFDQAVHNRQHDEDDEEEELVLILVTHGAGCNALIGALTGQPVLLDVGMASLTMAVRREDAPSDSETRRLSEYDGINGHGRRTSVDMGLNSVYEMKLISSSEHLRSTHLATHHIHAQHRRPGVEVSEPLRSRNGNVNSSLGSMRRPSAAVMSSQPGGATRSNTTPAVSQTGDQGIGGAVSPPLSTGLWTPPAARTPMIRAEHGSEERVHGFSALTEVEEKLEEAEEAGSAQLKAASDSVTAKTSPQTDAFDGPDPIDISLDGISDASPPSSVSSPELNAADEDSKRASDVPTKPPQTISRGLSQRGLWGAKPAGAHVARFFGQEPKRRWSGAGMEGES